MLTGLPPWVGALEEGLPLTRRPYRDLAATWGLGEGALLEELRRFVAGPLCRGIRAFWSAEAFGFPGALCAFDPRDPGGVRRILEGFPGVTHAYLREHPLGLWTTLQAPDPEALRGDFEALRRELGARDFLFLPGRRAFKVRVRFASSGEGKREPRVFEPEGSEELSPSWVEASEGAFPLVEEPFDALGAPEGIPGDRILGAFRSAARGGRLRRVGMTLHHARLGFRENLLAAWEVEESRLEESGRWASSLDAVSHCYARDPAPGWPYRLYTMLHASSASEMGDLLGRLEEGLPAGRRVDLRTLAELRKTGGCVGALLRRSRGDGSARAPGARPSPPDPRRTP